jgi:hypothetical protein
MRVFLRVEEAGLPITKRQGIWGNFEMSFSLFEKKNMDGKVIWGSFRNALTSSKDWEWVTIFHCS